MITKMSLVNITGPRDDIDRMADEYLSKYEIHLENALQELPVIHTLRPYTSSNPYQPWIDRIDDLLSIVDTNAFSPVETGKDYTLDRVKNLVEDIENTLRDDRAKLAEIEQVYAAAAEKHKMFKPFAALDYDFGKILQMSHMRFRFGRFTAENYLKFKKYIDKMVPSIFVYATEIDGYVYGVYFTPVESRQRVDALYYSLAWERIRLPEAEGDFSAIVAQLEHELADLAKDKKGYEDKLRARLIPLAPDLLVAKSRLEDLSNAFSIRKYAAITREEFAKKETRYLVIGWMTIEDAQSFAKAVENDEDVTMYIEDEEDNAGLNPPTKIKNFFLAKPFELLTRMYGVPNYQEFDPTPLVALTYSLLFGAMFGDVGQGLLLSLIGVIGLIKPRLRAISMLIPIGFSSMLFGFLYGSIFGFEEIIPALWLHPMTHMTSIPFFGTLNTVFIVAVAFGMFLIIATMLINIFQQLHMGNKWEGLLDRNGLAGLIFYGTLVLLLVLYMTGSPLPATVIIALLLAGSLLTIVFKETIIEKLEPDQPKHAGVEDGDEIAERESIGVQFLTLFFETIENLLTYFSNSISFVRVGAFAISHAAMMSVVLMFAGATEGGSINWLVVVLGNLFVIGFEGLIVGIQVLRLEFYEIFSHFYHGDGIEFNSIWNKHN